MAAHTFMGPDLDLQPLGAPTAAKPGAKIGKATPKSGPARSKSITRDRRRILMEELTKFDVRQLSVAVSNAGKAEKLSDTVKGSLDVVFRNRLSLLTKIIAEERRLGTLKAQEAAARGQTMVHPTAFLLAKAEELYAKSNTLAARVENIKWKNAKVKNLVKTLWQAQLNYLITQIQAAKNTASSRTGVGAQVKMKQAYSAKPAAPARPGTPAIQSRPKAAPKAGRAAMAAQARPALQKKRLTLAVNASPPNPTTLQMIVKLVISRVPKRAGESDQVYLRRLIRIVQRACLITANLQTQGLSPEAAVTRAVNMATHRAELAILSAELRKGIRVAGGEEILDAWMRSQIPAVAQTAASAGAVATPAQSVPAAMAAANEVFTSQSLQPGSFRVSSETVTGADYVNMSESVALSKDSGGVVRMDASGRIVSEPAAPEKKNFLPSDEAMTASNMPAGESAEEVTEESVEVSEGEQEGETPWYKKPAFLILGAAALGGLAYYGYKKSQSAQDDDLIPEAPETLA